MHFILNACEEGTLGPDSPILKETMNLFTYEPHLKIRTSQKHVQAFKIRVFIFKTKMSAIATEVVAVIPWWTGKCIASMAHPLGDYR